MRPSITPRTCLAALAGIAPATAGSKTLNPCGTFKDLDANHDGHLSLSEFKANGMDDLSFRAADTNGDGRVDRGEFDKYVAERRNAPKSRPAGIDPPQAGYPSAAFLKGRAR